MIISLNLSLTGSIALSPPAAPDEPDDEFGPNIIQNGGFDDASNWTSLDIAGGVGNKTSTGTSVNTPSEPVIAGATYVVTFTVTQRAAGNVRARIGGTLGTVRSAAGTYEEELVAGTDSAPALVFAGSFGLVDISVDDVEAKVITASIPEIELSALSWDGGVDPEVPEGIGQGAGIGQLVGATSGSTLTLVDAAGDRADIDGVNIYRGSTPLDFETATSHSITVRETLAGATNSPRDTMLTFLVSDQAD